jgi:hypothetical protein
MAGVVKVTSNINRRDSYKDMDAGENLSGRMLSAPQAAIDALEKAKIKMFSYML